MIIAHLAHCKQFTGLCLALQRIVSKLESPKASYSNHKVIMDFVERAIVVSSIMLSVCLETLQKKREIINLVYSQTMLSNAAQGLLAFILSHPDQ